jgi:hypothetical protein
MDEQAQYRGNSGSVTSGQEAAQGRVIKKIAPGQLGAKRWEEQFGQTLLCVRYREDINTRHRYTTVELVVDVRHMPLPPPAARDTGQAIMAIHLGWGEIDLQRRVRAAGGKWDGLACVWLLMYSQILAMNLQDRIVTAPAENLPRRGA